MDAENPTDRPIDLPPEYRFDVARAVKSVETLAQEEPEALIALTLAQLGAGGLEAESDIRLRVTEAAALLATVGEDQRLQAGSRHLVVLRIARSEDLPPPETNTEW